MHSFSIMFVLQHYFKSSKINNHGNFFHLIIEWFSSILSCSTSSNKENKKKKNGGGGVQVHYTIFKTPPYGENRAAISWQILEDLNVTIWNTLYLHLMYFILYGGVIKVHCLSFNLYTKFYRQLISTSSAGKHRARVSQLNIVKPWWLIWSENNPKWGNEW